MPKEIVGIGAANVDIMGESAARLVMEDSNPGTLSVSVGGVTRNVCENTARLGLPTRLITTVGEDMYGEKIRSWCRECGIATDSFITLPGKNRLVLCFHPPQRWRNGRRPQRYAHSAGA